MDMAGRTIERQEVNLADKRFPLLRMPLSCVRGSLALSLRSKMHNIGKAGQSDRLGIYMIIE
jgi:hypothetical protein